MNEQIESAECQCTVLCGGLDQWRRPWSIGDVEHHGCDPGEGSRTGLGRQGRHQQVRRRAAEFGELLHTQSHSQPTRQLAHGGGPARRARQQEDLADLQTMQRQHRRRRSRSGPGDHRRLNPVHASSVQRIHHSRGVGVLTGPPTGRVDQDRVDHAHDACGFAYFVQQRQDRSLQRHRE